MVLVCCTTAIANHKSNPWFMTETMEAKEQMDESIGEENDQEKREINNPTCPLSPYSCCNEVNRDLLKSVVNELIFNISRSSKWESCCGKTNIQLLENAVTEFINSITSLGSCKQLDPSSPSDIYPMVGSDGENM